MDLTGIFTIGGKPGLQKLVAQSPNGVIVESLKDGKRFNAYSSYKISSLEDISVYSTTDDVPLRDVLTAMGDQNDYTEIEVPGKADLSSEFKKYIDFDEERVYVSDIKKIFGWYNMLVEKGIVVKGEAKSDVQETKEKKEQVK
jgi:hypothetical protein|tara:strand:+ start:593 stop:1021 length:429 start_codon:yes stop_codon:yes gene_type:complete